MTGLTSGCSQLKAQDNALTEKDDRRIQDELDALKERVRLLEEETQVRRRVQILSIGALYAVMAALIVLHWAGHLMRHQ